MNDTVTVNRNDTANLNFNLESIYNPRSISRSEDGLLAVLYPDNIGIGNITFFNEIDERNFIFKPEKINLDFHANITINPVADFDFEEPITGNKISDETVLHLLLDEEFTIPRASEMFNIKYSKIEWSPRMTLENILFLAVMKGDGRIYLMTNDNLEKEWTQKFDLTDLYHNYYKTNILVCPCSPDGNANCVEAAEYIRLKLDLKPIDFSWSGIVRSYYKDQYLLITTMTLSGVLTIWKVTSMGCILLYKESLETRTGTPLFMKFCDITDSLFMIAIAYSDERVITKTYKIQNIDSDVIIERMGRQMSLAIQRKHNSANKMAWSCKNMELLVGYGSEVLGAWFSVDESELIQFESAWIDLPSNGEITGITVHQNMAYVTSFDGFLYGIKLDVSIENVEVNVFLFNDDEVSENNEFYDVFLSQNGVHLGVLRTNANEVVRTGEGKVSTNVLVIKSMSEAQILNILMDETKSFNKKYDAIEEMKYLYFNKISVLSTTWHKFVISEVNWRSSSLHHLQLIRYFCIFFGYNLRSSAKNCEIYRSFDIAKIRKLEMLILLKSIAIILEKFSNLPKDEVHENDCLLVMSIIAKLQILPDVLDMAKVVKTAFARTKYCLVNFYEYTDERVQDVLNRNMGRHCPACRVPVDFNVFYMTCSHGHRYQRCCQTLDVCQRNYRQCTSCGATQTFDPREARSRWRRELMSSNCPLCDGTFAENN